MTKDERSWARHDAQWRHPAQVVAQWEAASSVDPKLLRSQTVGAWWEVVERTGVTLLASREYEHLVLAMTVSGGEPAVSFMRMPHPSGIAVDRIRRRVYIASTRNPNQVFTLIPLADRSSRRGQPDQDDASRPLIPVSTNFYPGSLYIHDLALVGGVLHANAVGQNAIVRLDELGGHARVWWPRAIERAGRPDFSQNYLQLNSIAAGPGIESSYFSASAASISRRRPGHLNFAVDHRGVVFAGDTREPMATGLTRPHSARLRNDHLWVANSGYGEVGLVEDGGFEPVQRLPGWTRGLCFVGDIAFVGTSRVIPRFHRYAPGLDAMKCVCGIHAIDVTRGEVLGCIVWPAGNQIFGIEWIPRATADGLPFSRRGGVGKATALFYRSHVDTEGSQL